ncbi:MAG TPA: hypothetical protein DCP64_02945, partial [Sarcina sp.]|nr:hypothetical protein [Sarcina sp.]
MYAVPDFTQPLFAWTVTVFSAAAAASADTVPAMTGMQDRIMITANSIASFLFIRFPPLIPNYCSVLTTSSPEKTFLLLLTKSGTFFMIHPFFQNFHI